MAMSNVARSFSHECCLFNSSAMYDTADCKIAPLFLSEPGMTFASSLMPSLMVSRRRRSTVDTLVLQHHR
jgi:hypothetical protein